MTPDLKARLASAVTGTRLGATTDQIDAFEQWLMREKIETLHHGDCVGADAEAAKIAERLGCRVICHPPAQTGDRAYVESDETRQPLTYLARNRAMVEEAKRLIGFPRNMVEEERGGTWYTIRYALKRGYPVTIIWPNGRVDNRPAKEPISSKDDIPAALVEKVALEANLRAGPVATSTIRLVLAVIWPALRAAQQRVKDCENDPDWENYTDLIRELRALGLME